MTIHISGRDDKASHGRHMLASSMVVVFGRESVNALARTVAVPETVVNHLCESVKRAYSVAN